MRRTLALTVVLLPALGAHPPAAREGAVEDWMLGPFVRRDASVLSPRPDSVFPCPVRSADVRWEEGGVGSPAAVVREGKVHLLYPAEDAGGRGSGTSRIGLAVSGDGVAFERRPQPVLFPDDDFMMPREWEGGLRSPRVVEREDGTYVVTYAAFDGKTARLAVASSLDLVHWTKHGLAFGQAGGGRFTDLASRSGAIVAAREDKGRTVAVRIGGKYWMYWGGPDVFTATSDNLVDWTPASGVVLSTRRGRFDSALVEPGPPALLTSRGILLLHNASNDRPSGDPALPDAVCIGGQVLMDAVDPTAVLARATEPFFRPPLAEPAAGPVGYETCLQGLVFFKGRWLLYHGMAGAKIGVAEFRP